MKRRRKRMKIFHRQPGEYPFRLTCFRLVGFQFESRCFFLLSLSPRARCTAAHTNIGDLLSHWRSYDFCYCSMLFPNIYSSVRSLSLSFDSSHLWTVEPTPRHERDRWLCWCGEEKNIFLAQNRLTCKKLRFSRQIVDISAESRHKSSLTWLLGETRSLNQRANVPFVVSDDFSSSTILSTILNSASHTSSSLLDEQILAFLFCSSSFKIADVAWNSFALSIDWKRFRNRSLCWAVDFRTPLANDFSFSTFKHLKDFWSRKILRTFLDDSSSPLTCVDLCGVLWNKISNYSWWKIEKFASRFAFFFPLSNLLWPGIFFAALFQINFRRGMDGNG